MSPRRALPLLLLLGCGVDSSDVPTERINATVRGVVTDGGPVMMDVILIDGRDGPYLNLDELDTLTATDGSQTITLEGGGGPGVIQYTGEFPASSVGSLITVSLVRQAWDDAPSSTLTVPSAASITEIGDSLSPGELLDVSWTGSPGDAVLLFDGPCITNFSVPLSGAEGSTQVDGNTVEVDDFSEDGPCDLSVRSLTEREGTLDPAFGQGSAPGRNFSSAGTVRWTP